MKLGVVALISLAGLSMAAAFCLSNDGGSSSSHTRPNTPLRAKKAGTFFNPVPENNDDDDDDDNNTKSDDDNVMDFDAQAAELLRQRKGPSLASQPSTINGKPTAGVGFGAKSIKAGNKTFVGIGPRLNDPTKPEYDDQGYTLYADENTGARSRVFEALVDYPCKFTMKIVGAIEGNFVQEMVEIVAASCRVTTEDVPHSVRQQGKWVSVTVRAPVESAEMLYSLYENVDKDPRVKVSL